MAETEIQVEVGIKKLGSGSSKEAFELKQVDVSKLHQHNFTIPDIGLLDKFCIVKYRGYFNWRTDFTPIFFKFKKKMDSDQLFKYYVANGMTYNGFLSIPNYVKFIKTFNVYAFNLCITQYYLHDKQYKCMDELMEIHKLGKLYAPELRQIRIDKINIDDSIEFGIPFPPEQMELKFKMRGVFKVSYLIEKCDSGISEYLTKNPHETDAIGENIVEFINSFVTTHKKLNCDIKSPNVCLKITYDGKIESTKLLDTDPSYNIDGKTTEFKHNAKVFMKLLFFFYSRRWTENGKFIFFSNWHITRNEVIEMIGFFYTTQYMIYEKNPINMLFHYLIHKNPKNYLNPSGEYHEYEFLHYDSLFLYFKTEEDMIKFFMIFIDAEKVISSSDSKEEFVYATEDSGVEKLEGGKKRKSRRRKNTQKLMKNRQPLSSRKNNQA